MLSHAQTLTEGICNLHGNVTLWSCLATSAQRSLQWCFPPCSTPQSIPSHPQSSPSIGKSLTVCLPLESAHAVASLGMPLPRELVCLPNRQALGKLPLAKDRFIPSLIEGSPWRAYDSSAPLVVTFNGLPPQPLSAVLLDETHGNSFGWPNMAVAGCGRPVPSCHAPRCVLLADNRNTWLLLPASGASASGSGSISYCEKYSLYMLCLISQRLASCNGVGLHIRDFSLTLSHCHCVCVPIWRATEGDYS